MKKILFCDVDSTVVDTLNDWINWYEYKTKHFIDHIISHDNDNVEKIMNNDLIDPLDYWRRTDLYDNLKPINQCVDVLKEFKNIYDIIFISDCFNEHINSKRKFLKKHFPFIDKFIVSKGNKGKHYCNIIIDDYYKNLDQFDNSCKKILKMTRTNGKNGFYKPLDWSEIYKNIKQ